MYRLIRKLLFCLPPEQAHAFALHALQLTYRLKLLSSKDDFSLSRNVFGLHFPNIVGLAAGFDKNAEYVDALAALGFGFIEVGTVTPKPQSGHAKPRLFRLVKEEALINRMGFNNKGVTYVAQQLEKTAFRGILGINIGMNRDTPLEKAIDDYLFCLKQLKKYASYFTVNISSPNTTHLRSLQQPALLSPLLRTLKEEAGAIPLIVKISPDMTTDELHQLTDVLLEQKIDGIIATNTTVSRNGVTSSPFAKETGGLSGRPLSSQSTAMIHALHSRLQNKIPIIASGGVMDAASAKGKIKAGATLLQIYSGFIYEGPTLIKTIKSM